MADDKSYEPGGWIPFRPNPEIMADFYGRKRQTAKLQARARKALEAEIAADRAAGRIPPEDETDPGSA
ncbi:MAG: hypothetical protein J7518_10810 [Nocardioidaceae bacterium]|nr:hypothetical protein [Nocardioidaceae bacterium]